MPQRKPAKGTGRLNIYLLSSFRIERGAESIQLPTRKVESLLAFLVLNQEKHSREKLAALFWGDSSDAEARNSLRNALAVINKKLGHNLLVVDRRNVEVNSDYPLWVDVLEFSSQADSFLAEPVPDPGQIMLRLYQTDLLSEFYDDWIFPHREYYRSLFIEASLQLTQQMRSRSEYNKAIEVARRVLMFDPVNERAHQHLMFCFMMQGDRSSALRQYEICQHALREELGVEPMPATIALYEWVKQTPDDIRPFESRITNLPIPHTSFIGRKHEIAEIQHLLSSTKLLTLTGAGGSGKTRLAIQLATDLLDSFEDGVWWVDLAPLTDKSLVLATMAKALGVKETANQTLLDTLRNILRPKQLLLVIDNCEHLIETCTEIALHLLEACPSLKIIATSRESLGIKVERAWYVPTLSLPDPHRISLVDLLMEYEGIRLFVERAITARADFALTDRNASFVAEICRQLDGIPLAIELAAAKIKVLSVEQIAARLSDMFQLLTGGSRAALPRHQTLQAALDWSYDLLTTKERLLFCRLAVFSGGWTLEAMEAVCSTSDFEGDEVVDLLSSLVDKSLIIREEMPDGGSRYRMLETIRQYTHDALSRTGEMETFQERHLDYFVNLAEAANPHLGFFLPDPQIASWANILEPEQDNLWTAFKFCRMDPSHKEPGLRMAAMLHWFWFVRGYFTEGRNLLDQLLAESGEVSLPVQAQAFLSAGFLACWQGDFSAARTSLKKSLKAFEEMEEPAGIAFSLHGLGFAANGLGDHAQAGALFGRCQELARKIGDKWLLSFALHFIAIGSSFQGNYQLAVSQFEECIKLIRGGAGNLPGVAFSLFHLGRIARLQGDHKSAHIHYSEGIGLFWQMGDRRGIGYSLSGFACLALAEEETVRAARLIGAVDSIREDLGILLETILQFEFEQTRIAVQQAMGREKYDSAWADGHALPLELAVQFAIGRGT